jgi:putative oxidoreductase
MYIPFDWILLLVRIVLAASMIHYGWPKVRSPSSNASDFVRMGFKPGILWGTLIAAVEFFGGLAILFGLGGELAAALFGFQMMVGAFWKLKLRKSFPDYSYDLQLFALCLVVMYQGTGPYTLKAFPGTVFLRWDVAAVSLVGALLLAALSKPHSKSTQQMAGSSAK